MIGILASLVAALQRLMVRRAAERDWPKARALQLTGEVSRDGAVAYCSSCHNPVKDDPEMRRRMSRRCQSFDQCHGPGIVGCIILRVSWS